MGLTTVLETETGEAIATIEDPTNLLYRALPTSEDATFQWANTIDWYADTTFNRVQAQRLRTEWARLLEVTRDDATASLLRAIDEILQRCDSEPHLYVKFYGD